MNLKDIERLQKILMKEIVSNAKSLESDSGEAHINDLTRCIDSFLNLDNKKYWLLQESKKRSFHGR